MLRTVGLSAPAALPLLALLGLLLLAAAEWLFAAPVQSSAVVTRRRDSICGLPHYGGRSSGGVSYFVGTLTYIYFLKNTLT